MLLTRKGDFLIENRWTLKHIYCTMCFGKRSHFSERLKGRLHMYSLYERRIML